MKKVTAVARKCKNHTAPTVRTREYQQSIKGEILELVREVVAVVVERALQREIAVLLGRERAARRDFADPIQVKATCNRCGTSFRRNFYRGGSYVRALLTTVAFVDVRVPRLSCACGGTVDLQFDLFAPYQRIWFDLQERVRQFAGICVSLRDSVDVLAAENGQALAISTINGLVNEAAVLADAFRKGVLATVPAIVVLDGIWVRLLGDTEREYTDKRGRRRLRKQRRKVPILVAYGIDPQSGEKRLLDWEQGQAEDEASWQRLLERLEGRGLRFENGLRMFIHDGSSGLEAAFEMVNFGAGVRRQRCIFHKLRNVVDAVHGDPGMSRKQKKQRREEVVKMAADVYSGKDRPDIEARLKHFGEEWREREPEAVLALERGFEATLVYLDLLDELRKAGQNWPVRYLRTTSMLERANRAFRQKFRQVVIFHSNLGLEASIQLVIAHRGLGEVKQDRWIDTVEEGLKAA